MQQEAERMLTVDSSDTSAAMPHGPSADFIYAISEFLDTDPKDLLVELGYQYGGPAETNASQAAAG